ncbi:MAG: hypothetical protein QXW77_01620, partial [Candidatus Hadarchaeales archaeon]
MERAGVSVIIFAIMVTMVLLMVFALWYRNLVYNLIKEAEVAHMQLVYEDFRNLQFTLSKLAENG